jgi:hypothetical protein
LATIRGHKYFNTNYNGSLVISTLKDNVHTNDIIISPPGTNILSKLAVGSSNFALSQLEVTSNTETILSITSSSFANTGISFVSNRNDANNIWYHANINADYVEYASGKYSKLNFYTSDKNSRGTTNKLALSLYNSEVYTPLPFTCDSTSTSNVCESYSFVGKYGKFQTIRIGSDYNLITDLPLGKTLVFSFDVHNSNNTGGGTFSLRRTRLNGTNSYKWNAITESTDCFLLNSPTVVGSIFASFYVVNNNLMMKGGSLLANGDNTNTLICDWYYLGRENPLT